MRKCYQSFKRLLTGQEGSMAPAAVAAAIAMLLIILGVSEYMRLAHFSSQPAKTGIPSKTDPQESQHHKNITDISNLHPGTIVTHRKHRSPFVRIIRRLK
jgi:hypothetical protein